MSTSEFHDAERTLADLGELLNELSPEQHKAAVYILENPLVVGVSSIRELAEEASVTANTLVRLSRYLGFSGFEDFRDPFKQFIKQGHMEFQDRAAWLQSLSGRGKLSGLYSNMASCVISNIESSFAGINAVDLEAAAKAIIKARKCYVLGVGVNYALASNFAYLTGMALNNVNAIPESGNLAIDSIARAGIGDVLLATTFKPYRTEVVDAVEMARSQGVQIIGLSDSPASPIITASEYSFVVNTETPQFFTSTVAAMALLETLTAFVVASAKPNVVKRIREFHDRRHALGIYVNEAANQ